MVTRTAPRSASSPEHCAAPIGRPSVPTLNVEATVFRDQMINFLEASVIFLLLTNALSVAATTYLVRLLNRRREAKQQGFIERKLGEMAQRAS
jgi:hypothetical protein